MIVLKRIKGVGVGTQGELIPLSAADYRSRLGSIPSTPTKQRKHSSTAELIAHNGLVAGSNPAASTI